MGLSPLFGSKRQDRKWEVICMDVKCNSNSSVELTGIMVQTNKDECFKFTLQSFVLYVCLCVYITRGRERKCRNISKFCVWQLVVLVIGRRRLCVVTLLFSPESTWGSCVYSYYFIILCIFTVHTVLYFEIGTSCLLHRVWSHNLHCKHNEGVSIDFVICFIIFVNKAYMVL